MADIDYSYQNPIPGTPVFEVMDNYNNASFLTAGAEPGREQPVRLLLESNTSLAKYQVVGLNANKKLVAATYAADGTGIKPIGVLEHPATSGANNTSVYGETILTGVYNVGDDDAGKNSPLVWDASFTSMVQKINSVIGNALLIFRQRKVL